MVPWVTGLPAVQRTLPAVAQAKLWAVQIKLVARHTCLQTTTSWCQHRCRELSQQAIDNPDVGFTAWGRYLGAVAAEGAKAAAKRT